MTKPALGSNYGITTDLLHKVENRTDIWHETPKRTILITDHGCRSRRVKNVEIQTLPQATDEAERHIKAKPSDEGGTKAGIGRRT